MHRLSDFSKLTSNLQSAFTWGAGAVSAGIAAICPRANSAAYFVSEAVGIYFTGKTLISTAHFGESRERGVKELVKNGGRLVGASALMMLATEDLPLAAVSITAGRILGACGGGCFVVAEIFDPRVFRGEITPENCTRIKWSLRALGTGMIITGVAAPTLSATATAITLGIAVVSLKSQANKIADLVEDILLHINR